MEKSNGLVETIETTNEVLYRNVKTVLTILLTMLVRREEHEKSQDLHAFNKGFFPGCSGFPPSTRGNTSKFQFDRETEGHRFVSRKTVTCNPRKKKVYLFICLFICYVLFVAAICILLLFSSSLQAACLFNKQ